MSSPVQEFVEVDGEYTGTLAEPVVEKPAEPVAPVVNTVDLYQLKAQLMPTIEAELRQKIADEAAQAERAKIEASRPKDEFDELSELVYNDPNMLTAMRRAAEIGERRATERLSAYVQPTIQELQSSKVVTKVAGDLGPEAQEFIRKFASQVDPAKLDGDAFDLLRSAAELKDQKAKAERPKIEPAQGEPGSRVRIDNEAYEQLNAQRKAAGLENMTAAEFAALQSGDDASVKKFRDTITNRLRGNKR